MFSFLLAGIAVRLFFVFLQLIETFVYHIRRTRETSGPVGVSNTSISIVVVTGTSKAKDQAWSPAGTSFVCALATCSKRNAVSAPSPSGISTCMPPG